MKKGKKVRVNLLQFDLFQKPEVIKRDIYKRGKAKHKPTMQEIDDEFMSRALATGITFEDKKLSDIKKEKTGKKRGTGKI